jgi:hypothetical protein
VEALNSYDLLRRAILEEEAMVTHERPDIDLSVLYRVCERFGCLPVAGVRYYDELLGSLGTWGGMDALWWQLR